MTDIDYLKKYLSSDKLDEGIERLKNKEPVQYIVGNVNFYGNLIKVNKNVLIPRFETEELVEYTINYIKKIFNKKISIVDLGTGSGCIAITLKKEIASNITAIDISSEALEVARENAKKNEVEIKFIKNNMLDNISDKFDVIISNPPYIDKNEEIMEIVKNNEPHLALYADNEGLYYYEKILKQAKNNLNDKFIIAFEIGYKQGEKIKKIAKENYPNAKIRLEYCPTFDFNMHIDILVIIDTPDGILTQ